MKSIRTALIAGMIGLCAGGAYAQTTLRIGLAEDPDGLDPTFGRTFVGRIVFAGLCDKLFDVTPDLKIVPQLATGFKWSDDNKSVTLTLRKGVKFHDGEAMDAAAVKYNIDRHLTMKGSLRKSEIGAITSVVVVDDSTVTLNLAEPFAPLLAHLTDRAGMMVSPKAAEALGDKFGGKPVCAGPYKLVERVIQDRIVLEKFVDYWDKDNVKIDRIVYQPIPDSTIRLANLRSGQLDIIERLAATDVGDVKKNADLKYNSIVALGYVGITLNLANGEMAKTPLGQDPRIRQALELSIDRDALNQVVFDGEFLPGNQWVSPQNPYYAKATPVPKRDVEKAKALLKEAGQPALAFTMMLPMGQENERVGQVVQAMAKDAGIDIKLQATENTSALALAEKGQMQAFQTFVSGRTDPDSNLFIFLSCNGPLNVGKWCNEKADKAMVLSRTKSDPEERARQYQTIATEVAREVPIIYLYHPKWLYASSAKLKGFEPVPDGLIRVKGLTVTR